MKRIILAVVVMTIAAAFSWSRGTESGDAKPTSTNAPGREYPKVDSQRRDDVPHSCRIPKRSLCVEHGSTKGDDGY
jgi:hypothetical protein